MHSHLDCTRCTCCAVYPLVGFDLHVGQPRYCHVHHGGVQSDRAVRSLKQFDLWDVQGVQGFYLCSGKTCKAPTLILLSLSELKIIYAFCKARELGSYRVDAPAVTVAGAKCSHLRGHGALVTTQNLGNRCAKRIYTCEHSCGETFTLVKIHIVELWIMAPCSLVDGYQQPEGTKFILYCGNIWAAF